MDGLTQFMTQWTDDCEYIVAHTSGSTGIPKEIRLLKRDMKVSARATNRFFGINSNSCIGMALSTDYIAGKMMAVRAAEANCEIVQLPTSNNFTLDGLSRPLDLLAIVPSQIAVFIAKPDYKNKVHNLLIGGASPSYEDCKQLVECGYCAYISYGMTETCSHVALSCIDGKERIYHAMPNIRFSTSEDHRLLIEAPSFSFGRLQTNDVVDLISPTSFIWKGRADGVINSGGIKLYPEELEHLYAPFLSEYKYYVTHCQDAKWGQAVCLVFEGQPHDEAKLRSILTSSINDHRRIPKYYLAVSRLPSASNGKIKRLTPDKLCD